MAEKIVDVYHSEYHIDTKNNHDGSAEVVRTSANLEHVLVRYTYFSGQRRKVRMAGFPVWNNGKIVNKNKFIKDDDVDNKQIYISNDGKYYKLVKRMEGDTTIYNIVSISSDEQDGISSDKQVIGSINITDKNPTDVRISVDGLKYMYRKNKDEVVVGFIAEPQKRVSVKGIRHELCDSSALFDTVVAGCYGSYIIKHIDNSSVLTTTFNCVYGIKVSYDGQTFLIVTKEIRKSNKMFVYTASGELVVKRKLFDDETIMAITNKYLITYSKYLDEFHLWSLGGLGKATKPDIQLVRANSEKKPSEISNVKVILGENDSFLCLREVTYGTGDNKEKVLEGTKFKIEFKPYTPMQFSHYT